MSAAPIFVEGQSDLIKSLQEAAFLECFDLKREFIPVQMDNLAVHKVDGELRAWDRCVLDELLHLRAG